MSLYLYDDARSRTFEPFALTRPTAELCAGALVTRQRWARICGEVVTGLIVAEHLREFAELDSPSAATRLIPAGARIANSRCVPALAAVPAADVLMCQGRVACLRLPRALDPSSLDDGATALESLVGAGARTADIAGRWIDEVWHYIRDLPAQLNEDIPALATTLPLDLAAAAASTVTRLGEHPLFVEQGAIIEPHAVFDLRGGPVLVRAQATVQAFTRVVGPCAIGEGSTVTTDRIASASIGDRCKVHGELAMSIVLGHTNKSHDGFVGHSYLGRWVNLGAGTITSNLKNTYGAVQLWTPHGARDTGLTFLGSLIGDYVRTGIGLRLMTGTVVGAGANIFGPMAAKVVPPFAWGERTPFDTFALPKFLEVAERQMARRDIALSDPARRTLAAAHARVVGQAPTTGHPDTVPPARRGR